LEGNIENPLIIFEGYFALSENNSMLKCFGNEILSLILAALVKDLVFILGLGTKFPHRFSSLKDMQQQCGSSKIHY
jgi:hypothetical protein